MSYEPQINNKISTLNSVTLTPFSGGTVWYGQAEEVSKYGRAGVSVYTPFGEPTDGVLWIEVSRDGVEWGGPPRTFSNTSTAQPHMWNIIEPYFRLRYENGTSSASTFQLTTQYSVNSDVLLGHQLDEVLIDETEAIVTKSVFIGKNPTNQYVNERTDGYAFTTTSSLSANGIYDSGIISTDGYSQIQTELFADQPGTLVGYWYASSTGGTILRTFTRPYSATDVTNGLVYFSSPIFAPYFEYTYTNGSSGQTSFFLGLKELTNPISGQIIGLEDFIPKSVVANLGRNVIVGRDIAGNYRNVTTDAEGHIKVHIDEPLTAFGELRNAELTPIIQITHPFENNYDLISSGGTTGSGSLTYDSTNTLVEINSGAATSSTGVMRSSAIAKYRNGQGMVVRFTNIFATPVSGNTQFVGWGDSEGGFFFGYSGTTFGVNRRYNSVDNFTSQTSWNIDKMDGSSNSNNPSAQLLDPTKGNVYELQLQWLGFGAIRFNIESNESGQLEPIHTIKYSNQNIVPSVTNPNFPIYFESKNTTNNTNVVMKSSSMAAFVEGKVIYTGKGYNFRSAKTSGTNVNMLTLSLGSTYKGKTNRSRILLDNLSMIADGTQSVSYSLVLNGTITTPSFSSISTYSMVSGDTAGTYTGGTGRIVATFELNKSSNLTISLREYEAFVYPGDRLSIIANGTNTGAAVSMTWLEDV